MKNVLALVVLVTATHTLADSWSDKNSAFLAKQAEERKRLGLDSNKAKSKYPTPEVHFGVGSGMAAWVCPGQPSQILLEGKIAPGSLVNPMSDAVTVVKEEFTAKGWLATLNVKPGTKGRINLQVIAPVSGITSTIELPVGCPEEWTINLKNGDRAVIKVIDGERFAPGEWFRKEKLVEARNFELSRGTNNFTMAQAVTDEDRARQNAAAAPMNNKDLQARQAAVTEKMQNCATLPPAQMAPCIQKYSGELQEVMAAQNGAMQQAQSAMATKVGCMQFTGTIEGKKLKGDGMNCSGVEAYEAVPFTGVIK
jgi:hypothetical protein